LIDISPDDNLPSPVVRTIQRRTPGVLAPLSAAQELVWLQAQLAPNLPIHNETITVHRKGTLDVSALESSLNEIIRRHEAWRTTFDLIDGELCQIVQPHSAILVLFVDLRGVAASERDAEAVRVVSEDVCKPFDLKKGPLWRAKLLSLADDEHRLCLTVHRIIVDPVKAYQVFLRELRTLYAAFCEGKPSPLLELSIQYSDYAIWQRRQLRGKAMERHLAYWREQLAGELPALKWPWDRPRADVPTFRAAMRPVALPDALIRALKALGQQEDATQLMIFLAGFAVLLHRYTGQTDIILGTLAPRPRLKEVEGLLGCFLNPLVLRLDLAGNPTFGELVARVRGVVAAAEAHRDVPFGHLVKALQLQRDASRNPLFQIMLSLESPTSMPDSAWNLTWSDTTSGASNLDFHLELLEGPDRVAGRITYNADLFEWGTIERVDEHWQTLLDAAAANPGRRTAELPVMTDRERHQMVIDWNATGHPHRQATIHQLFESRVDQTPHAIAVVFENQRRTYRELNARANQLARSLRKLDVGPEALVAVFMERSLEVVVALLGILKAGGAYLPLAPADPKERLGMLLESAAPVVLITQERLMPKLPQLPQSAPRVVLIDGDRDLISREDTENLLANTGPENLAYVLYTSGSTGAPKGVQVEHGSVVNVLTSFERELGFGAEDVMVATTTLSFDIAGLEIFLPLITGARLEVARHEVARDPTQLASLLLRSHATAMQATPTTWEMLLADGWRGVPKLRMLCGGETLTPERARQLLVLGDGLWNVYGPTETTIWSTTYRVNGREVHRVPIGRPIANTLVLLLDESLNPVPLGVPGEIYIGGEGVARGYLNQPLLTTARFMPTPSAAEAGGRQYKTGDLGRYLPDGNIEFLGRLDDQVKIRGFRIEIGEIEAALIRHPAVRQTAVRYEEGPAGKRLVAYLVFTDELWPSSESLRAFLGSRLPDYMIPVHFIVLDTLPMTAGGKIDRRRLAASGPLLATQRAFVAARSATENALTRLWEEALQLDKVGIDDNFFNLGGHSLLAVRLFTRIGLAFGKKPPLSTLLQAPTIRQLAAVLDQMQTPRLRTAVVSMRSGSSSRPFFCVHGIGGGVLCLTELANQLGPDQAVFGLEASDHGDETDPPLSVDAVAARYLSDMRRVAPQGPYCVGGYSAGGVVAFEMAQQLRAQGEEVAILAILDGALFEHKYLLSGARRLIPFVRNVPYWLMDDLLRSDREQLTGRVRSKIRLMKARADGLFGGANARAADIRDVLGMWGLPDQYRRSLESWQQALDSYAPQAYPGRVTLFRARAGPLFRFYPPDMGWGRVAAGGVDVRVVPGSHETMLTQPYVSVLGRQLTACLAQVPGS
jgi:surfactin family lipopeptide synthetase A